MNVFDVHRMRVLRAAAIDVLSRHAITFDDDKLGALVYLLERASYPMMPAITMFLRRAREHDRAARLERIALLDALIAAYRERIRVDTAVEPWPHRDDGHYLRGLVEDLARLREVEAAGAADWKPLPRARPTSAKNAFATDIYFQVLDELGLNRSQKCLVSADLLIAAGIDDRPREKVQASLVEVIRNKAVRLK